MSDVYVVGIEGLNCSGKSTLLSRIRRYLADNNLPQDVFIDRFVASNIVYNIFWGLSFDVQQYISIERSVSRGLYLFLDIDIEMIMDRQKEKYDYFKHSREELTYIRNLFKWYFTNISSLPVVELSSEGQSYLSTADVVNLINSKKKLNINRSWDWNKAIVELSIVLSKNSKCLKRKVGGVFTRGKELLSYGYNRVPNGINDCKDCIRIDMKDGYSLEACRGLHCEIIGGMNALNAGVNLKESSYYGNLFPCVSCIKWLIELGVQDIYYREKIDDIELSTELARESCVGVHYVP